MKKSGCEILEKKGAAYYAVALAVRRIVKCILRDEKFILAESSLMDGQYGVDDTCLSLPSIAGKVVFRLIFHMGHSL